LSLIKSSRANSAVVDQLFLLLHSSGVVGDKRFMEERHSNLGLPVLKKGNIMRFAIFINHKF